MNQKPYNTPDNTQGSGEQLTGEAPECSSADISWLPELPRRLAPFRAIHDAMAAGLASDMGGSENMTTAQRALAASTLEVHLVRRRLGRNLAVHGLVKRNGELRAALASYFTACNTERLNWMALGLERRARKVDSYVAEVIGRERAGSGNAVPAPPLDSKGSKGGVKTEAPPEAPACNGVPNGAAARDTGSSPECPGRALGRGSFEEGSGI